MEGNKLVKTGENRLILENRSLELSKILESAKIILYDQFWCKNWSFSNKNYNNFSWGGSNASQLLFSSIKI